MPMVTVEWLEGRTATQKQELVTALTSAFTQIAKVPADHVWVVFRDVKRSDWGMSGQLLAPR